MLFVSEVFSVSFGQALSAISPSVYISALMNPFFLVGEREASVGEGE